MRLTAALAEMGAHVLPGGGPGSMQTANYASRRRICPRARRYRYGARSDDDLAMAPGLPSARYSTITAPICVPDADGAVRLIRRHHESWLSAQMNLQAALRQQRLSKIQR